MKGDVLPVCLEVLTCQDFYIANTEQKCLLLKSQSGISHTKRSGTLSTEFIS